MPYPVHNLPNGLDSVVILVGSAVPRSPAYPSLNAFPAVEVTTIALGVSVSIRYISGENY